MPITYTTAYFGFWNSLSIFTMCYDMRPDSTSSGGSSASASAGNYLDSIFRAQQLYKKQNLPVVKDYSDLNQKAILLPSATVGEPEVSPKSGCQLPDSTDR